jgi:TDG/mug DNA glycosylase family protein
MADAEAGPMLYGEPVTPPRSAPLDGRHPTKEDLARFASAENFEDVLPAPGAPPLRLLICGINPGLWTAAVNGPFGRPGNRFWPSLHRAGLTDHQVDASLGLSEADERMLAERGIGITNLVRRATAKADELSREELRIGARELVTRVQDLRPRAVAIAGITAYRSAYEAPKAKLGRQESSSVPGWPEDVLLWVVPQPSGLNAHENIDTLAQKWRVVWEHTDTPPTLET